MIKSYKNIIEKEENSSFSISRMEHLYEKRNGKKDAPHRHNYYTILIVKRGKGVHIIDFEEHLLKQRQVFFIAPGQVHQLIETEKPEGYAIVIADTFFALNNIPIGFIDDLNLFENYGSSPPLKLDKSTFNQLITFSEEIIQIFNQKKSFWEHAIASYIKLMLINCQNACSAIGKPTTELDSSQYILKNFKQLINAHFIEWHLIKQYADKMNITADHLNKTIKKLSGKSAKELLQSRITTAAKRMLFFTNLSNKEIAFQLGFSEPSNFSSFFKNCTGVSPSDFRKKR